ncbi:MAG TPA: hydrogenase [Candidatus Binatia bacterium]|nr:hydrogenase [Candidatus Binatia bacterium]
MSGAADFLLAALTVTALYAVATSRLAACVRASALQGFILAALPLALEWRDGLAPPSPHVLVLAFGALAIKAVAIPALLLRSIRAAGVRREVEPMASLHISILGAAALVALAFWIAGQMVPPFRLPSRLLVPVAVANVLLGFLLVVARRQAVTQVVGYLVLENGVFVFGLGLASHQPIAVELSVLLDVLVGVFVMGIAINHISQAFDHIDTTALASLRE